MGGNRVKFQLHHTNTPNPNSVPAQVVSGGIAGAVGGAVGGKASARLVGGSFNQVQHAILQQSTPQTLIQSSGQAGITTSTQAVETGARTFTSSALGLGAVVGVLSTGLHYNEFFDPVHTGTIKGKTKYITGKNKNKALVLQGDLINFNEDLDSGQDPTRILGTLHYSMGNILFAGALTKTQRGDLLKLLDHITDKALRKERAKRIKDGYYTKSGAVPPKMLPPAPATMKGMDLREYNYRRNISIERHHDYIYAIHHATKTDDEALKSKNPHRKTDHISTLGSATIEKRNAYIVGFVESTLKKIHGKYTSTRASEVQFLDPTDKDFQTGKSQQYTNSHYYRNRWKSQQENLLNTKGWEKYGSAKLKQYASELIENQGKTNNILSSVSAVQNKQSVKVIEDNKPKINSRLGAVLTLLAQKEIPPPPPPPQKPKDPTTTDNQHDKVVNKHIGGIVKGGIHKHSAKPYTNTNKPHNKPLTITQKEEIQIKNYTIAVNQLALVSSGMDNINSEATRINSTFKAIKDPTDKQITQHIQDLGNILKLYTTLMDRHSVLETKYTEEQLGHNLKKIQDIQKIGKSQIQKQITINSALIKAELLRVKKHASAKLKLAVAKKQTDITKSAEYSEYKGNEMDKYIWSLDASNKQQYSRKEQETYLAIGGFLEEWGTHIDTYDKKGQAYYYSEKKKYDAIASRVLRQSKFIPHLTRRYIERQRVNYPHSIDADKEPEWDDRLLESDRDIGKEIVNAGAKGLSVATASYLSAREITPAFVEGYSKLNLHKAEQKVNRIKQDLENNKLAVYPNDMFRGNDIPHNAELRGHFRNEVINDMKAGNTEFLDYPNDRRYGRQSRNAISIQRETDKRYNRAYASSKLIPELQEAQQERNSIRNMYNKVLDNPTDSALAVVNGATATSLAYTGGITGAYLYDNIGRPIVDTTYDYLFGKTEDIDKVKTPLKEDRPEYKENPISSAPPEETNPLKKSLRNGRYATNPAKPHRQFKNMKMKVDFQDLVWITEGNRGIEDCKKKGYYMDKKFMNWDEFREGTEFNSYCKDKLDFKKQLRNIKSNTGGYKKPILS